MKYKFSWIWSAFVLFVCGINGNSLPKVSFELFEIDKLAHLVLFGTLAWLIYYEGVWKVKEFNTKKAFQISTIAFLFSASYGALIEGLQATIFINRSFDWADMLADAIGGLLVYILNFWFKPKAN